MFIKMRLNLTTILISLFLLTVSTPAFAVDVIIDPGLFNGTWNFNNQPPAKRGIATVDMPAGSSAFIAVSDHGVITDPNQDGIRVFTGNQISIDVDISGNVTVVSPIGSATVTEPDPAGGGFKP